MTVLVALFGAAIAGLGMLGLVAIYTVFGTVLA